MTHQETLAGHSLRGANHDNVVVVGGGPVGLSTSIRLKQRAVEKGTDVPLVVLEKGAASGAYILSGAIMESIAPYELFSNRTRVVTSRTQRSTWSGWRLKGRGIELRRDVNATQVGTLQFNSNETTP